MCMYAMRGGNVQIRKFRISPSLLNRVESDRPIQIESGSFAGPYLSDRRKSSSEGRGVEGIFLVCDAKKMFTFIHG